MLRTCFPFHYDHSKKWSSARQWGGSYQEQNPGCYLVSDLLPPGMWDNKWVPSRWRCLNDNKAITGCIILVNFGFPCCKLWVKSYLYLQFADRVSDDSSHLSELSMLGRKSVDPCWVSDQYEETALYSSLIYFRGNETQK